MRICEQYENKYNVNTCGYLKERNLLQNNLVKRRIKNLLYSNKYSQKAFIKAQVDLKEFINTHRFKSFLYSLYKLPSKIPAFCSGLSFALKSKEERLAINSLKNRERKVKDNFGKFRFRYEGQDLSYSEIGMRFVLEKDLAKKEDLHNILYDGIGSIENDIRNLVAERNSFARLNGFDNYYQYALKKYGTSEEEVERFIEYFISSTEMQSALEKRNEILAKHYGLQVEELKPVHNLLKLTDISGINEYFETPEQVYDLSKDIFNSAGFDLEKLIQEGKITVDISPKANLFSSGVCYTIKPGKIVSVCTNTTPDSNSLRVLLHELGHAVFGLDVHPMLPDFLKHPQVCVTEAVALMFERLCFMEKSLGNFIPEPALKKYMEYSKMDEYSRIADMIIKTKFEQELYRNPNRDFTKLFQDIDKSLFGLNPAKTAWFSSLIIEKPGCMQNYTRGFYLADKIYNYVREKLGSELSCNEETANLLRKKIFRFGGLMSPAGLEKKL